MRLKNIPFAEYLLLPTEEAYIYTYSFRFGFTLQKPVDIFGFKDIQDFTFGQVKDVQAKFEQGIEIREIPEVLSLLMNEPNHYYQRGVVEVFQQFAWLKSQIEMISEAERQRLVRQPTSRELKAGLERFEDYGVYPQFRALAMAFGQTIDWVKGMPYKDAFLELCYQRDLSEYEIALSKIKE